MKVNYSAEDVVPVGSVLFEIENDEESTIAAVPEPTKVVTPCPVSTPKSITMNTPTPFSKGNRALATPALRKRAKDLGIDIQTIIGSGIGGRILDDDLERETSIQVARAMTGGRVIPTPPILTGITEGDQVKTIGGVKKGMTKTMTDALSIPFFVY